MSKICLERFVPRSDRDLLGVELDIETRCARLHAPAQLCHSALPRCKSSHAIDSSWYVCCRFDELIRLTLISGVTKPLLPLLGLYLSFLTKHGLAFYAHDDKIPGILDLLDLAIGISGSFLVAAALRLA